MRCLRCFLCIYLLQIWQALPSSTGEPDAQVTNRTHNKTEEKEDKGDEKAKRCEVLTDKNGHWKGSIQPGGVYVLTCDPGFAVDGKAMVNMTCSNDAEWPAKPWCEDIDDCALLLYGCGPAGLCKDHPRRAECICERGASKDIASNGEVVCHFDKASDCGGRNCGSHGVCVHLKEYQDAFDTGNSSFRCSCERGYMDDGESCAVSVCEQLEDPFGKWSGSHAYLGEYTLECAEGAFVWGGTEKAMTISCPSSGRWHTVPRCLSPVEERRKAEKERMKVFFHVAASAACILTAALAAGLTMGLVSLEPVELEIIEAARLDYCTSTKEKERLQRQKDAAKKILPLLKDHHLLLVTLLLLNACANEALPIFLDDLLSPVFAVLLSVTFVLVCGEILPSAVFTGPWQLTVSSWFVPVVRFLLFSLYCIAKPIARILDKALKKDRCERFSRPEVRAVLRLHSFSGCMAAAAGSSADGGMGFSPIRSAAEPLFSEEDPPEPPVLDDEEVDLCLAMLNLGDALVADSSGFYTLKQCARKVMPVEYYQLAICVAADAVAANKELVAVFPSLEEVQWPIEVVNEDITGILKVSELLTAGATQVGALCRGHRKEVQRLEVHETISAAVAKIGTMGFGLVSRGDDFFGIFDSEAALSGAVMGEDLSPRTKSSVRVAGLVVSASRNSESPSSNSSPGREPVPEAAQQMGKTLKEIAQLLTDSPRLACSRSSPLPTRDEEEEAEVTRFQTEPHVDRFGFAVAELGEVDPVTTEAGEAADVDPGRLSHVEAEETPVAQLPPDEGEAQRPRLSLEAETRGQDLEEISLGSGMMEEDASRTAKGS